MPDFRLWLEFEIWQPQPDDDPEDDFFNMHIDLPNGDKYALNVWTFARYERVRKDHQRMGDSLGDKYLIPPDLLVARLNRQLIEEIVVDMLQEGSLRQEWLVSPETTPTEP